MRRPILKNSNKKLKGNISLLVILILLASSVIGLLSINQIQRLITYWNQTFNYFRAFYLAKAWTELGLTEVYYREAGFNHSINSWDAIVSWNLNESFSGFNPYFEMTISGSFTTLTNDIKNQSCSWNKITLWTGEWIMISLFFDTTSWFDNILSDSWNHENMSWIINLSLSWSIESELTFAFFTYKYDNSPEVKDYVMNDIVVKTWNNLKSFLNNEVSELINDTYYKKYLTIKNSWNRPVEFCVYKGWELIPSSDSLITVRGNYGDMEVWLQSVVKKWVPDWALNVLWSNE